MPRLSTVLALCCLAACADEGSSTRGAAATPSPSSAGVSPAQAPPGSTGGGGRAVSDGGGARGDEAPPTSSPSDAKPARSQAPEPPSAREFYARRPPTDVPRVYAKTRNVWIRSEPTTDVQWIGFLWFGSSVRLRRERPYYGPGCREWYAVEPRGFVCVDGKRATLDPDDPELQAVWPYSPNTHSAWPHLRYGESIDAQSYAQLPSERAQRGREWYYRSHRARLEAVTPAERHPSLLGIDLSPGTDTAPSFPSLPVGLQIQRERLKPRSAVAWTREVESDGRTFVLTEDLRWVPKDRLRIYPHVSFRGVWLTNGKLDVAFARQQPARHYRLGPNSAEALDSVWERLAHLRLSGERVKLDGAEYLGTSEPGIFAKADEVVVPRLKKRTPWGEPVPGAYPNAKSIPDFSGARPKGRMTWMHASVFGGWLVAYEGTRPVFATLISPGRGGVPIPGKDPVETASTPTGTFKITGKFATATMVAPGELVHSAVPWAQNFSGPHALHGAYWHDRWGELKSGGCVNVSPLDAKALYEWTEPTVPEGWHGVRWLPRREAATTLVVWR